MIKDIIEFIEAKDGVTVALLDQDKIKYDLIYREICRKNSCGSYGRNYMCPPSCGEAEDMIAECQSYPKAVLYSSFYEIEDSFDIEGMMDAGEKAQMIALSVQKKLLRETDLEYKHLGAGGCKLCPKCAMLEGIPCRNPRLALTSLEACCIDVSTTAKNAGMKYTNGANTVTFFGLILYRE